MKKKAITLVCSAAVSRTSRSTGGEQRSCGWSVTQPGCDKVQPSAVRREKCRFQLPHRVVLIGMLCLAVGVRARADTNSPVQGVSLANPSLTRAAGGNSDSSASIISADGRFVLFVSSADNLVTNDSNGLMLDVFLRNRTNHTTTLVSVNAAGTSGGNGHSLSSSMSADGRFVAFESAASNLVGSDVNGASDIFLRDLVSGTTTLVSVDASGSNSGNGASSYPVITPDGRFVAFESAADDLADDDTNGIPDIFVRDFLSGTTEVVSVGARDAARGASVSHSPAMTPDGRYVAFASTATNLVAGVTNIYGEVYVRDMADNTTFWAGTNVAAIMAGLTNLQRPISCYNPVISEDGRYVAFKATGAVPLIVRHDLQTGTTDLVTTNAIGNSIGIEDVSGPDMTPDGRYIAFVGSTNPTDLGNVYLWDGQLGTTTLVSVNLSGMTSTTGFSDTPAISANGRFVAFLSYATDLVTNVTHGEIHIFIRDLQSGTTKLVSADTQGNGSGDASGAIPTISADGRFIAFDSQDDAYVLNDSNLSYDVFVRDTVADSTELISQSHPSLQSLTANNLSSVSAKSVSADGRFVTFVSMGNDLAANDTNGYQDVFVRDLQLGTNMLVSMNAVGTATGDGFSGNPVISSDGRYIVLVSKADDLVANDTNRADDVFVRDLKMGTTASVSINADGTAMGNGPSSAPAISADGRYAAFLSRALNLAPGPVGSTDNVYWRDLQAGSTFAVSFYGHAAAPSMSGDGRYVAYSGGFPAQLFIWDSQTRTTIYTNTSPNIATYQISSNGRLLLYQTMSQLRAYDSAANSDTVIGVTTWAVRSDPQISADGRYIAYVSAATNVVPNDTNGAADVFLYDRQAATVTLVSVNRDGTGAGNGASDSPTLSADGRFVAYRSFATDIADVDGNEHPDIFLFDRLTGSSALVSHDRSGSGAAGNNRSSTPVISANGNVIAFRSLASDLFTGDFNDTQDVFIHAVSARTGVDSDGDGMDDSWEQAAFGNLLHNGLADTDGDGFFDLYEYRAGTNPNDAKSVFQGELVRQLITDDVTLNWISAPGRVYRVQYKNSLSDALWTDLTGTVAVSGSTGSILDDTAGSVSQRYYRITLEE